MQVETINLIAEDSGSAVPATLLTEIGPAAGVFVNIVEFGITALEGGADLVADLEVSNAAGTTFTTIQRIELPGPGTYTIISADSNQNPIFELVNFVTPQILRIRFTQGIAGDLIGWIAGTTNSAVEIDNFAFA